MNTEAESQAPTIPAALANFDDLPDSSFVRIPVVAGLRNTSAATVWRHVKAGYLPKPQKLGPNTTAWNVGELRRAMVKEGEPPRDSRRLVALRMVCITPPIVCLPEAALTATM